MSGAERANGELSPEFARDAATAPAAAAAGEAADETDPKRDISELIPLYAPAAGDDRFFGAIPNFAAGDDGPAAKAGAPRDWRRLRAAASLAAVVAIGAAAAAEHVHVLRVARAEQAQSHALAHRLDAMSTRLETLESSRSRDELASLRKVLAEIKSSAASTRDVGGAVNQLGARVDRLEKDESTRLDKLADRIDREAAARLTDVNGRLDKLEAKVAATAAPAKPAPAAKPDAKPAGAKPAAAKAEPGVSYETTGSIDRTRTRLRGFRLAEIHNGYALVASRAGEFEVRPGDLLPGGAGRVLRIERQGRDWVVITTQGQIVAFDD